MRRVNGSSQKIYLLTANVIDEKHSVFTVEGTTGNIYTINCSKRLECDCPDHKIRRVACKHMYFIIDRVLKLKIDKLNYKLVPNLNELINQIHINKEHNDDDNDNVINERNDDCCIICYDPLETTLFKCNNCKHVLHDNCMKIWTKNNKNCPFCRYSILKEVNNDFLCKFTK